MCTDIFFFIFFSSLKDFSSSDSVWNYEFDAKYQLILFHSETREAGRESLVQLMLHEKYCFPPKSSDARQLYWPDRPIKLFIFFLLARWLPNCFCIHATSSSLLSLFSPSLLLVVVILNSMLQRVMLDIFSLSLFTFSVVANPMFWLFHLFYECLILQASLQYSSWLM